MKPDKMNSYFFLGGAYQYNPIHIDNSNNQHNQFGFATCHGEYIGYNAYNRGDGIRMLTMQVPIFSLLISGAMEAMRTMPITLDEEATATWQGFSSGCYVASVMHPVSRHQGFGCFDLLWLKQCHKLPIWEWFIPPIHVASRRQPPAPHRWAHTAGALRPKTSESTDCRKKKREEFDGHV